MTRFVAFLRGINVGNRIVKKETLQQVFTSLDFTGISTVRQSGNILFESNMDMEMVKLKIEEKLQANLGYEVAVFIRTVEQLKAILDVDPFKGQLAEGTSFLVTLIDKPPIASFTAQLPLLIPKSTAQITSVKGTEFFSLTHGGGEGALPNTYIESKLKVKATTRNINVIREIVEKFGT